MIKLYTTHCPKCRTVELKLKQKNVSFNVCDDIDTITKIGKEQGIMSAPILEDDNGKFYDFHDAIGFINSL